MPGPSLPTVIRIAGRRLRARLLPLAVALGSVGLVSALGTGPARAVLGAPSSDPCAGAAVCVHVLVVNGTLTTQGAGSGTVTSSPAGINCRLVAGVPDSSTACDEYIRSARSSMTISLTVTPDPGSHVATGCLVVSGVSCSRSGTFTSSGDFVVPVGFSTDTPPAATTTRPTVGGRLEAQLFGIRAARSRLGFRLEKVELQVGEKLTALLTLTRAGKRLASESFPGIQPGDRIVTLPVPDSVAAGKATLAITLTDTGGTHRTWTRALTLPRA